MKVLWVLVLIFGLAPFINGQNSILSGAVRDTRGALIPFAVIKLKDKKSNEFQTKTNNEGVYSIEITANLFNVFKIKKYFVPPSYNEKICFDVTLRDGSPTDSKGFFKLIVRKIINKQ